MSKIERLREEIAGSGLLNHHTLDVIGVKHRRFYGDEESKGHRAEQRRAQFAQGFPGMQFNRALGKMLDGTATQEDVEYVFSNVHRYEQVIERCKTEKRSVTITIVDFTPPNSENLS
ncbi:MAG: hypothetical protein HYW62_00460 [Candidatus Levybacteria bacterium]|nr:hypothetical protein [Candidatus Levybacteria bacterium]